MNDVLSPPIISRAVVLDRETSVVEIINSFGSKMLESGLEAVDNTSDSKGVDESVEDDDMENNMEDRKALHNQSRFTHDQGNINCIISLSCFDMQCIFKLYISLLYSLYI